MSSEDDAAFFERIRRETAENEERNREKARWPLQDRRKMCETAKKVQSDEGITWCVYKNCYHGPTEIITGTDDAEFGSHFGGERNTFGVIKMIRFNKAVGHAIVSHCGDEHMLSEDTEEERRGLPGTGCTRYDDSFYYQKNEIEQLIKKHVPGQFRFLQVFDMGDLEPNKIRGEIFKNPDLMM